MQRNVVIVSTSFWNSPMWFRRQHFAKRFADDGWKVLYVNPSFTLLRPFQKHNNLSVSLLVAFLKKLQVNKNLKIITPPPGIPFEGAFHKIRAINKRLISSYIEYNANIFFRGERYVLICYDPFDEYLILSGVDLLIYECVDEHSEYPENFHVKEQIVISENLLIKKADIVTVTTDSLLQCKRVVRNDINLIPNGVDKSFLFNNNGENQINLPEDILSIKRPIIIYVGAIYDWFNLNLVLKICEKHPEWSVVLIGPERILSGKTLPHNLFYLGTKNWKQLPDYLRAAEIAIIPFLRNNLTVHVNPLKLYEYFASGLTCVSSFMHELNKFEEEYLLEMAKDDETFIKALEKNIGKKLVKIDKKISVALKYSWDNIFFQLKELILSKIKT